MFFFFLLYNPSLVIFHEKENLPIILSFKYRFFLYNTYIPLIQIFTNKRENKSKLH